MNTLFEKGHDNLYCISQTLALEDVVSLSSTCRAARSILRPLLFATCKWKPGREPPEAVWCLIKHLHINTDVDVLEDPAGFLGDLGQLSSLHIRAETISSKLDFLLSKAINLDTLDLAHLCCKLSERSDDADSGGGFRLHYDALPEFHIVSCRPHILKFCSRFDLIYGGAADVMAASKMHATRRPFASLLAQIGVANIRRLEVGVEALSLPYIAPYTWSSLRELFLTGYWVDAQDDREALEDLRLGTPAWISENVHLGTFLASAPCLNVLRVRCRYTWWLPHSHVVLWPSNEHPLYSDSVIPTLTELELCNPSCTDGIFNQLPSSLRALALLTHPHTAHYINDFDEVQPQGWYSLTPADLVHILSLSRLPSLRELRISFRDMTDMRLFEYIAHTFPFLELLEFHSEAGENRYWSAHELIHCARALSPLRSLKVLRISTFGSIWTDTQWESATQDYSPEEMASFEWGTATIPLFRVVSALFGHGEGAGGRSLDRFPLLREVWLPDVINVGFKWSFHRRRVWRLYHVDWDREGRRCLRLDPGPHVDMVQSEW